MKNNYKVYALTSEKGIIGIESTAFHNEQELLDNGYVLIDEGTDGYIYGHAQPNYLIEKYGQPMIDSEHRFNYKLSGTTPILLTEQEKEALNPPVEPQPTEQDKINAMLMKEIAALKVEASQWKSN